MADTDQPWGNPDRSEAEVLRARVAELELRCAELTAQRDLARRTLEETEYDLAEAQAAAMDHAATIGKLAARIVALEAALRPFAEYARHYSGEIRFGDETIMCSADYPDHAARTFAHARVLWSDYCRALAALPDPPEGT